MAKLDPQDAPTLIDAGISEDEIESDLTPPEAKAAPVVPSHHIQCAYEALHRGSSVDSAAVLSGLPRETVSKIALEVVTCADKLGKTPPASCKAEKDRDEATKAAQEGDGKDKEAEIKP